MKAEIQTRRALVGAGRVNLGRCSLVCNSKGCDRNRIYTVTEAEKGK